MVVSNMDPNRQLKIDEEYMASFWEKMDSEDPFLLDGGDFEKLGEIAQRYFGIYKKTLISNIPEFTPRPGKISLYDLMEEGLIDSASSIPDRVLKQIEYSHYGIMGNKPDAK